jgi:Fic family protein
MDLLAGTPYLLIGTSGQRIVDAAHKLNEDVALLRTKGALDPKTLEHLRKEWRFREVYESAGIEGNQLTLTETQIAIQQGITISGKPAEHSDEVRHLNTALEYLEQLAHQSDPISEWEVKQIHTIILGRGTHGAGTYRNVEVAITNSPHKPPPPFKVQDHMTDYFAWVAQANEVLPIPLLTAICHAWLVHVHPFRDGNGRTARAVMNLLLMRHGYPIVIIRRDTDRRRYYDALRTSDDGDITPFFELLVERCEESLRQVDHARTAATGISLAIQKVREQQELKYRAWADGIRLFRSTLEDVVKQIETHDPRFSIRVTQYDLPSFDDYQGLCKGDPTGNAWLVKVQIAEGIDRRAFLLWIGFSSDELSDALGLPSTIPSIKVSVPNREPPPSWVVVDNTFPSSVREFAYHQGKYYRRDQVHGQSVVTEADNVVALTSRFVAELIGGWFAG